MIKYNLMQYIENIKSLKYISLDIFDTLVFRIVDHPMYVFDYMYENNQKFFPPYINGEEWRRIRIHAEKLAREQKRKKSGNQEVNIFEIYNFLPHIITNAPELPEVEFETEKKCCFLNQELYEQVIALKNKGFHLVLTSDMYLTKNQICELLNDTGVDICLFDEIYISSEVGKSKKEGKLFEYILNKLKIYPENLLHCGDDIEADIGQAKKRGIATYYFPLISEAKYQHAFFEMEDMKYGKIAKEIYAIRNIAESYNAYDGDLKEWFKIGAMILGPLFTYAMEWVIDQVEKNQITQIYPLMREGKILSLLLENAIKEKNMNIKVEPLYVSRKVLYDALKADVSKWEMITACETVHYKVKDIFSFYDILDYVGNFEEFLDYEISDLRTITKNGLNVYSELVDFLSGEKMLSIIKERHKNNFDLIYKYFMQKDMQKPFATVDIGWNGRIASGIQRTLNYFGITEKPLNLFICGKKDALQFIYRGTDIRGYVGTFGKNLNEIMELYAFIMEALCMCDEGTTIGYQKNESGEVVPVKQVVDISYGEQNEWISICQEGILQFQSVYFQYRKKNKLIEEMKYKERELCQIVGRLFTAPSPNEARVLGKLEYDVNMGVKTRWKIIDPIIYKFYANETLDYFYKKKHNRYVEWLSGMNVCKDPFSMYKSILTLKCKYFELKRILFAEKIVESTNESVILVGVGNYGKEMYKLLKYLGKDNLVECFMDNNSVLYESSIFGVPIYGINHCFKSHTYVICTANINFIQELYNQIKRKKGEQAEILSCLEIL